MIRIAGYKRAPMHVSHDELPLLALAWRIINVYGFSKEEATPSLDYIRSRRWSLADLPPGADLWAVVTRSELFPDIEPASRVAARKLTLVSGLPFDDDIRQTNKHIPSELREPKLTSHTRREMIRLWAKQPLGPIGIMAISLGNSDRHLDRSAINAEKGFAPGEFGIGDAELSNVLMVHPKCLECQDDRGLIACGSRFTGDFTSGYEVKNRRLRRFLHPTDKAHQGMRLVTAFQFE
jgi:hypothetical protein